MGWRFNEKGELVKEEEKKIDVVEDEELDVLKSAYQKYIRRGMYEKAMYFGLKLYLKNSYMFWRRTFVILVEDCLDRETINAVEHLYEIWRYYKKVEKMNDDAWDVKRIVVAVAYLLATSKKNRIADEFLEMLELSKKDGYENVKKWREDVAKIDEFVLDMHTKKGRARGIRWDDEEFWIKKSSVTANKDEVYAEWRKKFELLVLGDYEKLKSKKYKVRKND